MGGSRDTKKRHPRDAGAWGLAHVAGEDRLVRARRDGTAIVISVARESIEPEAGGRAATGSARPGVTAILSDLSLRHERLQLPPMKGARLRRALEQHFSPASGKTQGQEVSWAPYREEESGDLLTVSVEKEAPERIVNRLREAGFRVERLISPAAAIVGLLRETLSDTDRDHGTVIVHFGETIGTVGFTLAGDLLLAREFRMPASPREGNDAAGPLRFDPAWSNHLVGEIGRSLLYFNHQLKGKGVGRILISGDLEGFDAILPACAERFDARVERTADAVGLDPSLFGGGEEAKCEAGRWVSAIAAAVSGLTASPDIDLRPEASILRSARRRTVRIGATALLVLAGAMALFHGVHLAHERGLAAEIRAYAFRQKLANREAIELDEIRAARTEALRRLAFLEESRRPLQDLGEALRVLSLAATDGLALERVAYDDEEGPLLLRVEGMIRAPSGTEAQRQFNRFYEAIRRSPVFANAEVEPIEIRGDTEGESELSFVVLAEPEV
ncbi:MAG: hypothetical protein JW958_13340 [Candidatus Eisenbacteria bacterium]|nr:hypothetical protein [Candidatus Eisenbacteria bacterium]